MMIIETPAGDSTHSVLMASVDTWKKVIDSRRPELYAVSQMILQLTTNRPAEELVSIKMTPAEARVILTLRLV